MCLNECSLSAQNFYQNCKTGKACCLGLAAQPMFTSPNAARRLVTKKQMFPVTSPPCPSLKALPLQPMTGEELLRGEQLAEQVKGKKADGNAVY